MGLKKYRTYQMIKDILDQPRALEECLRKNKAKIETLATQIKSKSYKKIFLVGCSTTMYAGIVGKFAFEELCDIPTEVIPACEFADFAHLTEDALLIAISRSGETGDILAAISKAKEKKMDIISLVEIHSSTLVKRANYVLQTHAGNEGMVSIKSYTNAIALECLLAVYLGRLLGRKNGKEKMERLFHQIEMVPQEIEVTIERCEEEVISLAEEYASKNNICLLGRGPNYSTVMEGMLMIKEASLTYAEAMYLGDLKHGHINVINQNSLVIIISPDRRDNAIIKNIAIDVKSFQGRVVIIGGKDSQSLKDSSDNFISMSAKLDELISPLINLIPLQLFAFYLGLAKGINPDHGPGSEKVGVFTRVGKRRVYSIRKR